MLTRTIEHEDLRGVLWVLILALLGLVMIPLPEQPVTVQGAPITQVPDAAP